MEIREINLADIKVSEFNTRKDLGAGTEDTSLDDLANSIQEKGLLNPIMVRKRENGKYDLIVGQRRFLACKKIDLKTIPSIIRDELNDTDATIITSLLPKSELAASSRKRSIFSLIFVSFSIYVSDCGI